jgi:hypothetical protein
MPARSMRRSASITLSATADMASTAMATRGEERLLGPIALRLHVDQLIDRMIQLFQPGISPTLPDDTLLVDEVKGWRTPDMPLERDRLGSVPVLKGSPRHAVFGSGSFCGLLIVVAIHPNDHEWLAFQTLPMLISVGTPLGDVSARARPVGRP